MIDWTKPLCTKHETPILAVYLGTDPLHPEIHRASIYSPSLLVSKFPGPPVLTTFRYADNGKARGDGKPSENDLVNYHEDDGAVRIDLNGNKFVCAAKAA